MNSPHIQMRCQSSTTGSLQPQFLHGSSFFTESIQLLAFSILSLNPSLSLFPPSPSSRLEKTMGNLVHPSLQFSGHLVVDAWFRQKRKEAFLQLQPPLPGKPCNSLHRPPLKFQIFFFFFFSVLLLPDAALLS